MARSKEFEPEERLERARELFQEKGYNATSMQDLVDAMGLNRGSIYDTYGDKHTLFLKCLSSYNNTNRQMCKEALYRSKSPLQTIESIIRKSLQEQMDSGKPCLAARSAYEMGDADAAVLKAVRENNANFAAMFETLLVKAQEAGELPKDKDTAMLSKFIVSSFNGFWQTFMLYNNKSLVYRLIDQLMDMIKS
jgi:TetR/AcrR family transcriptional repressor of nem operon